MWYVLVDTTVVKMMKAILCLLLLTQFISPSFAQGPADGERPFVLGVTRVIQSKTLGEKRTINIYLPAGYRREDTVAYPVIYLLDGSADEDFIHVAGLVQFNSFEWVHLVPKSIVVGIGTVDRRRDFTFPTEIAEDRKAYPTAGRSGQFIAFLEKELQPLIERSYRTGDSRTIIGQSLGGLLATEILLKKPQLFSTYIIISPSLWWDNGSLLNHGTEALKTRSGQPLEVYVGVGKEGLTPTRNPRVMEVDANLLSDKLRSSGSKNLNVYFDYLPQENHATIMHQAVSNAFRFIYKPK